MAAAEEVPANALRGIDPNGNDCIWIRTIRDYEPLDDRHLLIRGPANRSYFVTLVHRSFELRSAFGLGFSSRDDQLCPHGGDAIVFDGLSRAAVNIRSITRVSSDQVEQLLVHFGKKEPDEQETTPPQPVKGAEVEELD